ncbi:alcohol dehydrogenase catalytic domain-containing protein [Paracoccus sp. S-4012]|uniref:alcohol dehydrogenase catalytic domain-containing protein n=1 Tax=Paracoccus sp. S-4012 TaxID=2665648 RepID=UPI0012B15517|nr:alcohol dehydrogenase catalytic domain-containing protein [Paracoccus sp. S-4012]MRX52328.1 alcohol dehydrogenase catalytic domain-containing protein [Paracoccus sp. S-4012]
MRFRAIRASRTDAGVTTELVMLDDSDLDVGEVTVRVDYSTINYKDGLAITNASPVIRRFPLIPGIDLAGVVKASDSAEFAAGDTVVLNGWGLSQTHDDGFAQKARVPADWLIKLPAGINTLLISTWN